jgi:putative endonuclease
MYTVYVLYSQKYDKIYIGQTEDIERRLIEHNNGLLSTYTKRYQPWEVIYAEEFETRSEAMRREKQLKTSRGRAFIWEKVKKKYK